MVPKVDASLHGPHTVALELSRGGLYQRIRGRGDLVVNTLESGSRGRGFEPHSGRRIVSLSKTYLPPKKYW